MDSYTVLHKKVFKELYNKLKLKELKEHEKELLYVYKNEARYRCQVLENKLRVLTHKINDEGNIVLVGGRKEGAQLPYMDFYEKIDSIFKALYERYGWDKYILEKKAELLNYYDTENSYRFPKAKEVNWRIENGVVILI